MKTYQHTQRGKWILIVMSIMSAVFIIFGATLARTMLIPVPLLIGTGWLFHSLTIEIGDGELRWRFGPGLIRKRVALAEITDAQQVRTNTLEGWGIHMSRFGCLYNISGRDAIAFTLRSGKRFALGTDEPGKLLELFAQ